MELQQTICTDLHALEVAENFRQPIWVHFLPLKMPSGNQFVQTTKSLSVSLPAVLMSSPELYPHVVVVGLRKQTQEDNFFIYMCKFPPVAQVYEIQQANSPAIYERQS